MSYPKIIVREIGGDGAVAAILDGQVIGLTSLEKVSLRSVSMISDILNLFRGKGSGASVGEILSRFRGQENGYHHWEVLTPSGVAISGSYHRGLVGSEHDLEMSDLVYTRMVNALRAVYPAHELEFRDSRGLSSQLTARVAGGAS